VKRFLRLASAAPCALLAAGLCTPAAQAQDAAYQSFQSSQFVRPGQIGRINPQATGGSLACPRVGVLASLYGEESMAAGGNSSASVASAQIAAAQAGCVTLPPATIVQVLSFYPLRAAAQNKGAGYLQVQGSTTGGAQWIGAGAVVPLALHGSGPHAPFGVGPTTPPAGAQGTTPVPAAQSLPQPHTAPANPTMPAVPQNGAPTMALPPAPPPSTPADKNQNGNLPGGYVPLPTLPEPSATPPKNPGGACSSVNSLINATQNGHGCTQP
jgi:hypothetical protein